MYSSSLAFFNVPRPGFNISDNSWFKSVHLIWLRIAERLISKLSSQSLRRRLYPNPGSTNIFPFVFDIQVSDSFRCDDLTWNFCITPFLESHAFGSSFDCFYLIREDEHPVSISVSQLIPFNSSLHTYCLSLLELVIYKGITYVSCSCM